MSYEKLPLINPAAPRILNQRNRTGNTTSNEGILQDMEDATTVLMLAGLKINLCSENIIEAKEKYMVESQLHNTGEVSSKAFKTEGRQNSVRKPHYTRLMTHEGRLIFQAGCCLPLKIIAASLDSCSVSGRILYNRHSDEHGGKLVYEFMSKGRELVIDLKRGNSTRAQRLIFTGIE